MLRFQFDIDGIIRKDVNIRSNDVVTAGVDSLTAEYQLFDREENVLMLPDAGRYYGSLLPEKSNNSAYSVYDGEAGGFLSHYVVNTDGSYFGYSGSAASTMSYTSAYSGVTNPAKGKIATTIMNGEDDA